MAKICFPTYGCGSFNSLSDAYMYYKKRECGRFSYVIDDIVRYNVCYRDYLREYGMEALIERLLKEAPGLNDDAEVVEQLRRWWENNGCRIADYDVRCYNVRDKVTILGHSFNGLKDIMKHCEMTCREGMSDTIDCSLRDCEVLEGVHIGEFYMPYPIFDSSDWGDNRSYRNYIFRRNAIDEADMRAALAVSHNMNFCMVHEDIPHELLPILYYCGDGDYMLLATSRDTGSTDGE